MARTCDNRQTVDLLIIDDQSVMRALIRDFLQSGMPDLVIAEAPDGARGMKLVAERGPRIVLMDVSLPDANGIDLAAQIQAGHPGIQVIMVSAMAGSAYVERAQAAGAAGYVRKDKIYTDLMQVVTRALTALPPRKLNGGGE